MVSSAGTSRNGTWVVTSTTRSSVGGEHHRDIHAAGELRQPFGVSGIGKAGQMEGVLLGGRGDDRVHFAAERQLDRRLDRVAGEPPRPDGAGPVVRLLAAALAPGADADPARGGNAAIWSSAPTSVISASSGCSSARRGDLRSDAARDRRA